MLVTTTKKRYLIFTLAFDYILSLVCLRFALPIENTDGKSLIFRSYRRYRLYRWTSYLMRVYISARWGVTKRKIFTFTDLYYRCVFISPSVPTDNVDLPMVNLFTIGTVRTDGQGFWGLPCSLVTMLTTSFTKGFCTFTDRVFICPSVPTDNFHLPMENWFTIGTDRTDGQGFLGLPYVLAIMLTTSLTKGFCTFTDRVFISPSVPTDNFDLPMDNWFTICTDRTDGQGFWGATSCPCNNANYLIHERILHIYRSCIHFSIRTDGQLRFTDGQLVYHRYRPYR